MPEISIVIPIFNMEKLLPRCLDSILGQTLRDIEVVAVDDCSTDGSVGVLESYRAADSRVKIVRHPVNHGTMWTRESGIEAATGNYFLFMDPDDALRKDACSQLVEAAIREDADLVIFDYETVYADGSFQVFSQSLPYGSSAHGFTKAMLLGDVEYTLTRKLFRRDLIETYDHLHIQGYIRSQDAAAMCIISPHVKKAILLDSPFYLYYQNAGSATNKRMGENALRNIMWTNAIRLESLEWDKELKEEGRRYCARTLLNMHKNGYDHKMVRSLAKESGLWDCVSFGTLTRTLGLRKALSYWILTHVPGVAPIVCPHK